MTNKEAIEHLKNIDSRYPSSLDSTFRDECEEIAIYLVIKALEFVEEYFPNSFIDYLNGVKM